jgi:hypothetical protein
MAGKRQHYIPQFLQRGFLADHPDDAERTWLHRRGAPAKLVGIRDVAVSEYFYSKLPISGEPTLDSRITDAERQVFADLENVRAAALGVEIDRSVAARLVSHLTFRTAHVRSTFSQGAMLVLDEVASYVGSNDRMREELGVDGDNSGRIGATLDQALSSASIGMQYWPTELAKRVITFFVRERFDELYEQIKPQIAQALSMLGQGIPNSVQGAHREVLWKSDLSGREKALATLSWRKWRVSGALLPDCIALVREFSGEFAPILLGNWDAVDCVVLPISHDLLLVGSRGVVDEIPISVLNEASSACSDNFFISQHPSHGEHLSALIGQRCIQTISAHVRNAVSGSKSSRENDAMLLPASQRIDGTIASIPFSFSLACVGFGDAELVATLGQIMKSLVEELGRSMPLSGLDGVTFSTKYEAAVEQLDRGDASLVADRSLPRDYGHAVAKCVRVLREGQFRDHIVFDAIIAYGLLQKQSDGHDDAIHMVVSMLSQIAHGTLYEERLRDKALAPPDDTARLMHQCVSKVPCMYFSARSSAFAASAAGERFAELTLASYKSACEAIRAARLSYRLDANLDRLLEVALPKIAFVLEHAAQWLGHRDGLPSQDEFPGMSLVEDLKVFDLYDWLELFGRDLQLLYATDDRFSVESIFALGRHAERLLWTVQICPWPTPDGGTYVTIPMGNDEQALDRPHPQNL